MEVDGEMGWTSASYLQKADLETVDDFAIKKYATGKGESKRAGILCTTYFTKHEKNFIK